MKNKHLRRLTFSAMMIALGMVLPFLTGQIKEIGDSLLPMHIPALLTGFICGPAWGGAVGAILPFLRSVAFGMPPIYPQAVWMACELAAYGFFAGIFYFIPKRLRDKGYYVYVCLIGAMLAGRIVWGAAKAILLGIAQKPFTIEAFIIGGFVDALPGIILQILIVPAIVLIINGRAGEVRVSFPYGRETITHRFKKSELAGVLVSGISSFDPKMSQEEIILSAMDSPEGERLSELARGKKSIVIIASDHTRPVPSRLIIPPMLSEIRGVNPGADITILIATGCHRGTKKEELIEKFGEDIVQNEKIVVHDCDDREHLINIGTLPSGGECEINSIAASADLLIAEGFIEPHFFAGFSGGRKSVLPGVAGRQTVLSNHCSEFIAHARARTGSLEGNPIHEDMLWAAERAGLKYIVNVVLGEDKRVIFATAGEPRAAHKKGTDFLRSVCGVAPVPADVVITTNGGYPLDQNVYQAVKGMTAAEATVRKGGVIIMLAHSGDGIGGDHFYRQLADEPDIEKTMAEFLSRGRGETVPDQWQTQIFLRVLARARVIYISELEDELIKKMHMTPAGSINEALIIARQMLGRRNISIVAIPDGVSVIVEEGKK